MPRALSSPSSSSLVLPTTTSSASASASASASSSTDCWYGVLLEGVGPTLAEVGRMLSVPAVLGGVPRAGLGGALLLHSARTLGRRRWREAEQAAVLALESYNLHAVSQVLPDAHATPPPDWLQGPLSRLRRHGAARIGQERDLISRVLASTSPLAADAPSPETVLFLRAAVAGATLVGDIPEPERRTLDTVALWWGLLLTPQLSESVWRAAGASGPPSREQARAAALEATACLPHSRLSEQLQACLAAAVPETRCRIGWEPLLLSPSPPPAPPPPPLPLLAPSSSSLPNLLAFQECFGESIEGALAEMVSSPAVVVSGALAHLRGQGGKRLRPLLVLAAAQAAGGEPAAALSAAAAVEWVHQSSLLIDDILDGGATRRGLPTLHTAGSVPFAVGVAGWILACLHEAPLADGARAALLSAGIELLWGQHRELCLTGSVRTEQRAYRQIITAKTAALFAAAAEAGAHSVGAGAGHRRALRTFGLEIGQAFQIIDDLLDYEGDTAQLGKPGGADLRARKVTLPVLLLQAALPTAAEREILQNALSTGDIAVLPWFRARMAAHGIAAQCRSQAAAHQKRALAALRGLPSPEGVAVLADLAACMVERQR